MAKKKPAKKAPAKKAAKRGGPVKHKLAPMTPIMKFYYDAWLGRPKLFGHRTDEHFFFLFVKACIQNSKTHGRDGHWLRQHLEREGNIDEHWIDKAVTWFDICVDYDHSMRFFGGGINNPHQFNLQPKDYRPWKERLKS